MSRTLLLVFFSLEVMFLETVGGSRFSARSVLEGSHHRSSSAVSVLDDPHFTSPDGVQFDFHGDLDTAYCVIADEKLQINTLLKGYKDKRQFGNSAPDAQGFKKRTWMKEIVFMWVDNKGVNHTFHLVARIGKDSKRGKGYLAKMMLDGKDLGLPYDGKPVVGSGLTFQFTGIEANEKPKEEREQFEIAIADLFGAGITMRPANPQLQTKDDAEVHINLNTWYLNNTEQVHGLMGQFYQSNEELNKKSQKYLEITEDTGKPIQADQDSGKGWLEGNLKDYVATNVTSPDCKVSPFKVPEA